jgi:ABC-type Fe3+ transport system permease subunit
LAEHRQSLLSTPWFSVAGTAVTTMTLAFFISWVVVRSRVAGRFFLDAAIFVPHVLPGSVIALGLVFTYLHPACGGCPSTAACGSSWRGCS